MTASRPSATAWRRCEPCARTEEISSWVRVRVRAKVRVRVGLEEISSTESTRVQMDRLSSERVSNPSNRLRNRLDGLDTLSDDKRSI